MSYQVFYLRFQAIRAVTMSCMILGKWQTWRTIFYVFIYICNSLHVSSTSCSSSGNTSCVNTTSGSCHSVSVAVSCAGRNFTSDLHTTWPPTATRGCIDTICLSWWWAQCARNMWRVKKINTCIKKCMSRWSFTKNHYMMHGRHNIKLCHVYTKKLKSQSILQVSHFTTLLNPGGDVTKILLFVFLMAHLFLISTRTSIVLAIIWYRIFCLPVCYPKS